MTPARAPATQKSSSKKALIIVGVVMALASCCVLGTLIAVAVPNFARYRQRSKQAEVKMTIRMLMMSEEEFHSKENHWATNPRQLIEYVNSSPNHYTCFLGDGAFGGREKKVALEQLPAEQQAELKANDTPGARFTIVCAGNLDEDPELDVWRLTDTNHTPEHVRDDFAP